MEKKRGSNFVILVVLMAVVAVGVWFISFRTTAENPAKTVSMPDEEFGDNPALSGRPEYVRINPDVSAANVLEVLASYDTPENMYWHVESHLYFGSQDLRRIGKYTKTGDDYTAIMTASRPSQSRSVTKSGSRVTVTVTQTGERYTAPSGYRAETAMGMASIDSLTHSGAEVTDAYRDIYLGEEVIAVEFSVPDLGQTEKYWISLEFGIPMRAEIRQGESLVFSAETIELEIR